MKQNFEYINIIIKKIFIIIIKFNRTVELSEIKRFKDDLTKISKLYLEDGQYIQIWSKGTNCTLQIIKKFFTGRSIQPFYVISHNLKHNADCIYRIYYKLWKIELYYNSIKQNVYLADSPNKGALSRANHIFASLVAFSKLEILKIKGSANHFTIKAILLLKASQDAFLELESLKKFILCIR